MKEEPSTRLRIRHKGAPSRATALQHIYRDHRGCCYATLPCYYVRPAHRPASLLHIQPRLHWVRGHIEHAIVNSLHGSRLHMRCNVQDQTGGLHVLAQLYSAAGADGVCVRGGEHTCHLKPLRHGLLRCQVLVLLGDHRQLDVRGVRSDTTAESVKEQFRSLQGWHAADTVITRLVSRSV